MLSECSFRSAENREKFIQTANFIYRQLTEIKSDFSKYKIELLPSRLLTGGWKIMPPSGRSESDFRLFR